MKGIVIIPTIYKQEHIRCMGAVIKRMRMYTDICKKYNFSYQYTDTPKLGAYDVAIVLSTPYHNNSGIPPGLLDAKCKLIGEFGDLQCWGNKECIKNKKILFDRYDILLGGYYEKLRERYPQHANKHVYWPQYFGPYERYASLSVNPSPKMRCLMIGSSNDPYYRRRYVINNRKNFVDDGCVDIVGPIVPFDKYPKYLNGYFCSLALPGKFNLPIAKYFEIPAARVLLLATETKEVALCGFKPYVNYVPVTIKNIFNVVKEVLDHPKDYTEIRDKGTKFVHENHSDINRIDTFKEIFNRLWPGGHEALLR